MGLISDALGFPSVVVHRQDKQHAAYHEETDLWLTAGKRMRPYNRWEQVPIINHRNFQYAVLICSELTNIEYRSQLRGAVDAVIVPEWNKDTDTYSSLVESAAQDIHAHIIQCNDRAYGDSRIRSPYKDAWLRDVVRVKGGIEDYYVIGDVDIICLRQYQSYYSSAEKVYKPKPDGFTITLNRRQVPYIEGRCTKTRI